jgi:hypothetical protein
MRTFAILAVAFLLAACESGGAAEHVASVTQADEPTPQASVPPDDDAPVTVEAPRLRGASRAEARATLDDLGLSLAVTDVQPSRAQRGTVVEQDPVRGEPVEPGGTVEVVLAAPLPRIPGVIGKQAGPARHILRKAGFRTTVVARNTTAYPDGRVFAQSPGKGVQAIPKRVVRLVVWSNVCTPGYSRCLPRASDYDCIGGTGDGPRYTGFVYVTGFDPYGLDYDNDGRGCE